MDIYLKACYATVDHECQQNVTEAANICIDRYQPHMPDVFSQLDDGKHWGSAIGSCAGAEHATLLGIADKRADTDNPECLELIKKLDTKY